MRPNDSTSPKTRSRPVVLAITGASGAIYAARLLDRLLRFGLHTHLVISRSGTQVIRQELDVDMEVMDDVDSVVRLLQAARTRLDIATEAAGASAASTPFFRNACSPVPIDGLLSLHRNDDYFTPIASGSHLTAGMVICPCSGATLSGISRSASANLIQRAAEVHLKERRKLVVVPRETPVSTIQLENMVRLSQAGAVVLPAAPGWYQGASRIVDLVDFIVDRILDQLGIDNVQTPRWQEVH